MSIRLWGQETLVNTTAANGQTAPVVTALQNGGYVIAWVDDMGAATSAVKFQRFDAFGNKVGLETIVPSDGEGDQDQVSICTLSNGTFVIAHQDADPTISPVASSTALTRFAADGTFLGQTYNGGENTFQPSIHPDGTGFRLSASVYLSSTDSDVFTVRYDVNGVFQTASIIDSAVTIEGRSDVISTQFDGLVAVYTRNEGTSAIQIMMRTGADGTGFASAPIVLSDFGGLSATTIREAQIGYLGARPDGGGFTSLYVVAFNTFDPANGFSNIGIKILRSDGTILANLDQISGTLSEILVQPDQSFYLVYQSAFGAAGDIKIRHYDKAGALLGLDVTVSSNDLENAQSPSIAQLADGRIVVTWMDTTANSDGSGAGINQQIIDPRDGIVNGANVAGVAETLVGNDSTNDQIRGFAGIDTIYGLAGADAIYGGDGNDFIFGGRGDDTMYGGIGNDNMVGGAGADEFNGGAGTDVANYNDAKLGIVVALDGSVGSQGDAVDDAFIGVENVSGSRFDDTIIGNVENNSLFGGKGNDVLRGLDGNDGLRGGEGGDTMTGGAGNDTFFFNSQLEANGGDVITDFSSNAVGNNDRVALTGTAFGLTAASFTAANFQSGTSATALAPDIRVFYETDTGILRYDADGNSAGAAIVLATLTGAPTLVFSDVVIL